MGLPALFVGIPNTPPASPDTQEGIRQGVIPMPSGSHDVKLYSQCARREIENFTDYADYILFEFVVRVLKVQRLRPVSILQSF